MPRPQCFHRCQRVIAGSVSTLRRLVLMLVVVTVPLTAWADALSFDDTVKEAAANNADLRNARANLAAAGYNVSAAYAGYFPQASAGVSYSHTTGSAVTTTGTSAGSVVVTGSSDTYSASVSVNQNLFAGFQDSARIDQGDANRVAAEASYAVTRATVSQSLKVAFANLKYAQDSVALADSIVRRLEENVRLVGLRFDSGRENKGSLLLTQASLAQARLGRLQAMQAVTTAQASLAQALGRSESRDIEIRGEVPTQAPGSSPDFVGLTRQTPQFQLAVATERAAAAGITLARSAYYPNLNLTGSVGRLGSDWFPEDSHRAVGVNLTVPIFSGGRDYYSVRSAAASFDAASSSKESVERQTRVVLEQAYSSYVQAVEQVKVNQAFVDAALTRAEIARSQYNNGLLTFNDWNLIENDLTQRQTNYVISQRDRVSAEAAWEQAQGKGVIP